MLLIINNCSNAYYNLAAEEYFIDNFDDDIVMLWRNDNTVVVGKNQNTIEEINSAYVEENNISVVRRLTGGGAVFHDMGNVNYTVIQNNREGLFSNYEYFTEVIRQFLAELGISAALSGRNDLMIDGKKFSGNAQCVRKGRMMHHGTLMFSSDVRDISGALTPNRKKIESKSVKSVRSHVTNISSHMTEQLRKNVDVEEFMNMLYRYYAQKVPGAQPYEIAEEDQKSIQKLADQKYSTWEWNYGASPAFASSVSRKYDFGLVDVRMNISRGRIKEIRIFGDYFGTRSISEIEEQLVGTEYRSDAIARVLSSVILNEYINGMTAEELTELIMQTNA